MFAAAFQKCPTPNKKGAKCISILPGPKFESRIRSPDPMPSAPPYKLMKNL